MVQESRDRGALVPARADAPNILLLVWDTVRASSLDLYGYELETAPLLTQFAREGIVFDRAFSTASYTLPSHASLFTGRWAQELTTSWRVPLNSAPTTLAEVLRSAGYRTGGFSANRIYVTREFGLGRGFMHFEEHRLGFQQVVRSSTLLRAIAMSELVRGLLSFHDDLARVHAKDNHMALARWLERDRDRPYFAFVNFMEAHTPYLPDPPYAHRFGWYREGTSPEERRQVEALAHREPGAISRAAALHAKRAYEASIAQLDAAVAAMLQDLTSRHLLENTLVIVTADHGEEFHEHGFFGHGNTLYAQSIQVPLVMVFPGADSIRRRLSSTVSLRDVPATILDLVGLADGFQVHRCGRSGKRPPSPPGHPAFSEIRYDPRLPANSPAVLGDLASVVDDSLQIIRRNDGAIEVFNLAADRWGNVPGDTERSLSRLRSLMPRSRVNVTVEARRTGDP
jgi:arylsulfatase A-like enzyme